MEGRWTLCANMRPGCEGAPIVRDGPRVKLYDHIPVVPCDDEAVERAARALCDHDGYEWGGPADADFREQARVALRAAGETP